MASGQENKKGFFNYPEAKEGCESTLIWNGGEERDNLTDDSETDLMFRIRIRRRIIQP